MGNLEHNIKEAFARNDANTKVSNKELLWNRLENTLPGRRGVAAFWRVAAIFLAFLLTSGVFAALNSHIKQKNELAELTKGNEKFLATIDSLKTSASEVKTEIQIVEEVVYRDRLVYKEPTRNNEWKEKYLALSDSAILVIANQEKLYRNELEKLQSELVEAKEELAMSSSESKISPNQQSNPFELKSERISLSVAKGPSVKNPEFKVQILQKNFRDKNDLNRTIFNN